MQSTATDPTDHNLVTIAMLRCCRLFCSAGNEFGSGGGDTGSCGGDTRSCGGDTGSGTASGPRFDTGGAGGGDAMFHFEAKITIVKRSKKFEAKRSEKKRKKRSEIL
jgi:hypothetical protein